MQYTTKLIEKRREQERREEDPSTPERGTDSYIALGTRWLEEAVKSRAEEKLVSCYHRLSLYYTTKAERLLALERDLREARRYYYLAALAAEMAYKLVRAGFPHNVRDGTQPYDFEQNNFPFTQNAILANAPELALSIAGENTVEGLILLEKYKEAWPLLPVNPNKLQKELRRMALWGIVHRRQKTFDLAFLERVKEMRGLGDHAATTLDTEGLALILLARRRGLAFRAKATELPWELLDDQPTDTTGLVLPCKEEVQQILNLHQQTQTKA